MIIIMNTSDKLDTDRENKNTDSHDLYGKQGAKTIYK